MASHGFEAVGAPADDDAAGGLMDREHTTRVGDGDTDGLAAGAHVDELIESFQSVPKRAKYLARVIALQFMALLRFHVLFYKVHRTTLVLRLVLPAVLLIVLAITQASSTAGDEALNMNASHVPSIPPCSSVYRGACTTIAFAPADDRETYDVMARLARAQGLSISPFVEDAETFTWPATGRYDIVGTPWIYAQPDNGILGQCTTCVRDPGCSPSEIGTDACPCLDECADFAMCVDPDELVYAGGCGVRPGTQPMGRMCLNFVNAGYDTGLYWDADDRAHPYDIVNYDGVKGGCPRMRDIFSCALNTPDACASVTDSYCLDPLGSGRCSERVSCEVNGCAANGLACMHRTGNCVAPTITRDDFKCCSGDVDEGAACPQTCRQLIGARCDEPGSWSRCQERLLNVLLDGDAARDDGDKSLSTPYSTGGTYCGTTGYYELTEIGESLVVGTDSEASSYEPNMNCYWTVSVSDSDNMTLAFEFELLDVEQDYDFVYVALEGEEYITFTGTNTKADLPLLNGTGWCATPRIKVAFKSDSSGQQQGVRVRVTAIAANACAAATFEACGCEAHLETPPSAEHFTETARRRLFEDKVQREFTVPTVWERVLASVAGARHEHFSSVVLFPHNFKQLHTLRNLTAGSGLYAYGSGMGSLGSFKWNPFVAVNGTRTKSFAKLIGDVFPNNVVLSLTTALKTALLQHELAAQGRPLPDIAIELRDAPSTSHSTEPQGLVRSVLPIMLFFGFFAHFLAIMIRKVNAERAHVAPMLRISGMAETAYLGSYAAVELAVVFASALVVYMVGAMVQFRFFLATATSVMLLFLFAYSCTIVSTALLLSCLVKSSRAVVNIAFVCFVIGTVTVLLFSFEVDDVPIGVRFYGGKPVNPYLNMLLNQMPPFAFARVCADIIWRTRYRLPEGEDDHTSTYVRGPGFSFDSLQRDLWPMVPAAPYTMHAIHGCFLSVLLHIALVWYLTTVFRKLQPAYFFLLPSYWAVRAHVRADALRADMGDDYDVTDRQRLFQVASETDPDMLAEFNHVHDAAADVSKARGVPLLVLKLSKLYRKSMRLTSKHDHRALDELSVHGQPGQVLGLVGHNGAGKTTLIRMLAGEVEPSSGDALIHGFSIVTQIDIVRQLIGVCPQHNALLPFLSAREHLTLISAMRGIAGDEAAAQVDELLAGVDLLDVADNPCGDFSGGMQRRLCVASALVGAPRVVFLDEPTTSLDPLHRRELWEIIQRMKRGRLVVLTTHMLEEADLLSDKICVLALGRMRAIGSPVHLKNRFGAGYHVQLTARDDEGETLKSIKDKMHVMLPTAHLTTQNVSHLTFSVPSAQLGHLTSCFRWIESEVSRADGDSLITDWQCTHSTVDEVFIRLTHGDDLLFSNATSIANDDDKVGHDASGRLNIVVEESESEEPVGFVTVSGTQTLADARQLITKQLDERVLPRGEWCFLSDGVAVSEHQESALRALSYAPAVSLRTLGAALTSSADTARLREENATLSSECGELRTRVGDLERELAAQAKRLEEALRRLGESESQ